MFIRSLSLTFTIAILVPKRSRRNRHIRAELVNAKFLQVITALDVVRTVNLEIPRTSSRHRNDRQGNAPFRYPTTTITFTFSLYFDESLSKEELAKEYVARKTFDLDDLEEEEYYRVHL